MEWGNLMDSMHLIHVHILSPCLIKELLIAFRFQQGFFHLKKLIFLIIKFRYPPCTPAKEKVMRLMFKNSALS